MVALLVSASSPARGQDPTDPWYPANLDDLVTLYQHLHKHPELSFRETNTAARVAEELGKAGAEVTTGVGKLGVVGILKNGDGPTVLIRTDMDALPVAEETGLPFASRATTTDDSGKTVGIMHACGHDIHMACLVGVTQWLASHRERWSGTIELVAQPAEETVSGARAMLEDGLYTRFRKPDFALALHVTNDQPTGTVVYTPGPALAGSTSLDIVIKGKGGHGAAPHTTTDPIVLAALAILDFQTIVSREIDPIQPAVITVGSVQAGTKHNIIPDEARLQLTLRAYREEVRDQLIDGLKRRIRGLAVAHNAAEGSLSVRQSTPPTVNNLDLVARIVPALEQALGAGNIHKVDPVMGAEDFGLFSRDGVPIFMFRLGTVPPERLAEFKSKGVSPPSLHSSKYHPDARPSLHTGIHAMTAAVLELLPHKP